MDPDHPSYSDDALSADDRPGPPCDEPGCREISIPVFLAPDDPDGRYCPEHAIQHGFCGCCGIFCAGIESFDFGRYPGYCDNCQDEFEANDAVNDEEGELEADLLRLRQEVLPL